jgi:hypothetical protein
MHTLADEDTFRREPPFIPPVAFRRVNEFALVPKLSGSGEERLALRTPHEFFARCGRRGVSADGPFTVPGGTRRSLNRQC